MNPTLLKAQREAKRKTSRRPGIAGAATKKSPREGSSAPLTAKELEAKPDPLPIMDKIHKPTPAEAFLYGAIAGAAGAALTIGAICGLT